MIKLIKIIVLKQRIIIIKKITRKIINIEEIQSNEDNNNKNNNNSNSNNNRDGAPRSRQALVTVP